MARNTGKRGGIRVRGIARTVRSVQKELNKIKNKSLDGLYEAALLVLRDSDLMTPIDLGNLRASGYVLQRGGKVSNTSPSFVAEKKGSTSKANPTQMASDHQGTISKNKKLVDGPKRFGVIVGYTAFYAIYVHENLAASHDTGQAKFLEESISKNRKEIIRIVKKRASR